MQKLVQGCARGKATEIELQHGRSLTQRPEDAHARSLHANHPIMITNSVQCESERNLTSDLERRPTDATAGRWAVR